MHYHSQSVVNKPFCRALYSDIALKVVKVVTDLKNWL